MKKRKEKERIKKNMRKRNEANCSCLKFDNGHEELVKYFINDKQIL